MRPLRFSINVTLDGCCDHRAGIPDEDLHRHHAKNLERNDGYKGFNQKGVSEIIARTDPRKQTELIGA